VPIGFLIFAFDVVLIVHTAKTGRFWPWAYVIFFLPGIGGIAYLVAELAPAWLGSHNGRRARQRVATTLDPTGRYRQLRDELDILDTIANRSALAEECLALGKYDEALTHYERILIYPLGAEPIFMYGKARAEFGLERPGGVVATLDELKKRWPAYQSADAHLLYARALEGAGLTEEALHHYADVSNYYPGAEPRVRQAELLLRLGRNEDARFLAEDVVRTMNRAPSHVRRRQKEWLAAAKKLASK
jgi:hypothetical protein